MCDHNSSIVLAEFRNFEYDLCTWGCGKILKYQKFGITIKLVAIYESKKILDVINKRLETINGEQHHDTHNEKQTHPRPPSNVPVRRSVDEA